MSEHSSTLAALQQLREGIDALERAIQEQAAVTSESSIGEGLPPLLHAREAAGLLRCDPETVYRMVRSGRLPHLVVGDRGVRIVTGELLAWIRNHGSLAQAPAGPQGTQRTPRRLRAMSGGQ